MPSCSLAREEPGGAAGEVAVDALLRLGDARDVPARRIRTRGCRRSPSSGRGSRARARPPPPRPRRAGCGSPCGSSRRRRRACPCAIRSRDQPARRPRLARARRPLDDEVPAVEREQERLHLLEVGRLDRRGRTARGGGSTRALGSGGRRRAASGRAARARPPAPACGTGSPGISASRQRHLLERRARA